jgi:ComF family protein
VCERCGDVLISTQVPERWQCGRCRRGLTQYDFCRSYGIYDGLLRQVIHRFKYGHRVRLGKRLNLLLHFAWEQWPEFQEADLILPVPLHRRRQWERGFNQSEMLARLLAQDVRKLFQRGLLIRVRNTPSQTGLSRRQRRLNVEGAFEVRKPARVKNKACLLVDDVLTTGATLNETATVLKRWGARKILVLTLARVSPLVAIGSSEQSSK